MIDLLKFLPVFFLFACGDSENEPTQNPPDIPIASVTLDINTEQTYQTIDGFGFFGARNVWWTGDESSLYTEEWGDRVIRDLGVTIWRNEYFPPSTETVGQDADWEKQLPVVRGLHVKAQEHGVDLKIIFTVWSPPSAFKCRENEGERFSGEAHPGGTKQGGTLDPLYYEEFGNWLADGIDLYKSEGIDIYAISPQNEPLFRQPFNSCFYTPAWYNEMLQNSMPVVKSRFPDIRIFGSENMLQMEGGNDRQYFYHQAMKENEQAQAALDILAVHGYNDGVIPTPSSNLAQFWSTHQNDYGTTKPVWMTETSGYFDDWNPGGDDPGAMDLALAIHSALYYGQASAWVYWQGTAAQLDEYNLMSSSNYNTKKYNVSKHFYRYIRPGAKRISTNVLEENVPIFATGFTHQARDITTFVLINAGDEPYNVDLSGYSLNENFLYFLTNQNANSELKSDFTDSTIYLPARSLVTLVSGEYYEK